jgi:hypothetical protein
MARKPQLGPVVRQIEPLGQSRPSVASVIDGEVVASGGYDLPAYENFAKLPVWAEAPPPKSMLYHYPDPYNHQTLSITASPAPPRIVQQIEGKR